MCTIAYSPAGVCTPGERELENLWRANPDGAGIMYRENGKVRLIRTFMAYNDLLHFTRDNKKMLRENACVIHFRWATHGAICANNTHPFPVTANATDLDRETMACAWGAAHNGIIRGYGNLELSDTKDYIARRLSTLDLNDKTSYKKILAETQSKWALMNGDGRTILIGSFEKHKNIWYSNDRYTTIPMSFSRWRYDSAEELTTYTPDDYCCTFCADTSRTYSATCRNCGSFDTLQPFK